MDQKAFETLVTEAIDHIPDKYHKQLDNVVFTIEDAPTSEQRLKLGLRQCDALFGLYEGIPLPKRGGAVHNILPDKITIFRHPMIDIFTEPEALKKQVFETVWHEVAHYYGLDHKMIHQLKKG